MEAGCIPIYWGVGKPEPNIICDNTYCFVNVYDKNDVKKKIEHVMTHKEEYIQTQLFKEGAQNVLNTYYEDVIERIRELCIENEILL